MKEEDFYKVENGETLQNNIELLLEDGELRKKLSFELKKQDLRIKLINTLTKLCTYSTDGYDKTVEIFETYKKFNNDRYKFKCLVETIKFGLTHASTKTHSQVQNDANIYFSEKLILNTLILVNNLINQPKRLHERIRIRSEFLALKLDEIFKDISIYLNNTDNSSINEQIIIFNESYNKDEYNFSPNDVDLNNHHDIFYAIYTQVSNTQNEYTFLCLLRHLLRIDNSSNLSNVIWEVVEKLTCRATVLDHEDKTGGLERYTEDKFKQLLLNDSHDSKKSNGLTNAQTVQISAAAPPPPPPPPPALIPPPPPPPLPGMSPNFNSNLNPVNIVKLPQQCVPKGNLKMKQITWSKIPSNRIVGKQNIWTKYLKKFDQPTEIYEADATLHESMTFFKTVEDFFKLNEGQPKDESKKDNQGLKDKTWHSAEKIEILKGYQGDLDKLGEAEKFMHALIQVPNYKLRTESLLLKEEFNSQMRYFTTSYDIFLKAADLIYNSFNLANMMLQICRIGNFITNGSYSGNAAGFKLSSLLKLADLKSNKHNVTLLHVIIMLEEEDSKIFEFSKEFAILKEINGIQLENFKHEVSSFCNRVRSLHNQVENIDNDEQINNLKYFIQQAVDSLIILEKREKDLETWKIRLADHFCEDAPTMKLEECFSTIYKFCQKFKSALQEVKDRRTKELTKSNNMRNSNLNCSTSDLTKQYFVNGRFYENSWLKPGKLKQEYSSSTHNLSTLSPNSSNTNVNELDDEAALLRRSSTKLSRRSSFKVNNQTTSNNSLQKTETANLFNFLNSGLEQSRELPTELIIKNNDVNKPSLANSSSNISKENSFKYIGEGNLKVQNDTSSVLLSNIKRYSSTGSLNTLNNSSNRQITSNEQINYSSIQEIPEETTNEIILSNNNIVKSNTLEQQKSQDVEKSVNKNFVYTGITTLDNHSNKKIDNNSEIVFPISLRRSMSTTQADQMISKKKREMYSAALNEEKEQNKHSDLENFSSNAQLKSSNRLSGLKKLGTLYKTFEDDEVVPVSRRQSNCLSAETDSQINTQNIENIRFINQNNNIEEYNNQELLNNKINSYIVSNIEVKGKTKLENNISSFKNDKNESLKAEDETGMFSTSGYKIFNPENNNNNNKDILVSQTKNNLNSDYKTNISNNNTNSSSSSSSSSNNSNNNNYQINRVNPVRLDNNSFKIDPVNAKKHSSNVQNFTIESSSFVSHKHVDQLVRNDSLLDNKVKSLSKNWETVAKPENTQKSQTNPQKPINNFPTKPNTINKLNSNALNKFRTHSEEDESEVQVDLSKENPTNFSGSHNSIIQSQLNKINQPLNQINYQTNKHTSLNTNPSIMGTIQQTRKEQEYRKENGNEYHLNIPRQYDLVRHSFHASQDYVVNPNDFENESNNKNKSIQSMYTIKKSQQQHQNSKGLPTKSNLSISNGSNSPPNTPPSNDENNDNSKRKSVSALYLSDTASTKAKKSEIKHKDTKSVLTINSASVVSPTITNSYSTNLFQNNNNISPTPNNINGLMINRRLSLNTGNKKPIVNINMMKDATASSQQLISFVQNAKNDSNISLSINCSSQNPNQLQFNETQNSNLRLNENTGDFNKKTSVFDRLSRTIKKQHDIH